jgi:hypothetical protein
MVTVISVVNNEDNTYDIEFSEPVAFDGMAGQPEDSMQMWTPSDGVWLRVNTRSDSQVNATTIRVGGTGDNPDNELLIIWEQPVHFSAANAFQVVSPQTPAT